MITLRYLRLLNVAMTAVLATTACTSARSVSMTDIQVRPDTVPLRQVTDPAGVAISVLAVIHNRSDQTLYRSIGCGETLHREINGSWETVWTPMCAPVSGARSYTAIAPGDSMSVQIDAFASTDPSVRPLRDPRMVAGRYRIEFGLSYQTNDVGVTNIFPLDRRVSMPFIVREP